MHPPSCTLCPPWPRLALLTLLFLVACAPRPPADDANTLEFRQLDTLVVAGSRPEPTLSGQVNAPPVYHGSRTRRFDLLHTALDLHFDWEEERVIGTAILRLTPYFYPGREVRLDARGMEVHTVSLESGQALAYNYQDPVLSVQLDKTYTAGEVIGLLINYTAFPSRRPGSAGKGFYFIQADARTGQGAQFWTQGETEANARWFPTFDQPNERATQEIRLTVPDSMRTLSNGILVASQPHGNATRTDHWKLDLPHAPYLAMVAAGNFRVEDDTWNGIPLQYLVASRFEGKASAVFPHTPEMLAFFSDYFGTPYPWPSYAQVAVRDFVAGAMENTTAVVFGDFMLLSAAPGDENLYSEKIVAHELVHHWFGNLVTCESWANLSLNEGFASYGEYLWLEHQYGRNTADLHLDQDRQDYFAEAGRRPRPIVYYTYADPENLFDRHSYNKGEAVLHMLRQYAGEQAFRAALALYLKRHAFGSVEIHDLRQAFEEVTGEDLNWFFDQWFLRPGHPLLSISYAYDEAGREAVVEVQQTQEGQGVTPVFRLPAQVEIQEPGAGARRVDIVIDRRRQSFRIPAETKPLRLTFDPGHILLAEKQENYLLHE